MCSVLMEAKKWSQATQVEAIRKIEIVQNFLHGFLTEKNAIPPGFVSMYSQDFNKAADLGSFGAS
jgi:hypothetical protein